MTTIDRKVAVITGASQGIGAALVAGYHRDVDPALFDPGQRIVDPDQGHRIPGHPCS
jgi:NAD(P)-dependent dehydrogenase (short-subunit alcohol dehydrogenase family)